MIVVLSCVLVLFTGSVFPIIKAEPGARVDQEELASYRQQLQAAGEDLFAEMQGELRRAQAQQFQNEAKAMQARLQAELSAVSEDLADEMLKLQLQVMLVSLSTEERQAKLDQISYLQVELAEQQTTFE